MSTKRRSMRSKPGRATQIVLQIAKIALALAVSVAGGRLLLSRAPEALQTPDPSPPTSVPALEQALRANTVSPYRWLELAEGYELADDQQKARLCFRRAEQLGPNLPAVWIRASGYHFRAGEKAEGLQAGAHAQSISDSSDAFLFQYYDRFVQDNSLVIHSLSSDRRALEAWLQHLMSKGQVEDAGLVWKELEGQQAPGHNLLVAYVDFLLTQQRYELAERVWAKAIPAALREGYPGANRLYNGGFEQAPSGIRLDWKITPLEGVEIERDNTVAKSGKYSLRVRFPGTGNTSFQHAAQTTVVTPGSYRLSGWLKMDGITTDQGVRLCVSDAEVHDRFSMATDPFRGTTDWIEIRQNLVVPARTNLLSVAVCRLPSAKFDNKISGAAWFDGISLVRLQ